MQYPMLHVYTRGGGSERACCALPQTEIRVSVEVEVRFTGSQLLAANAPARRHLLQTILLDGVAVEVPSLQELAASVLQLLEGALGSAEVVGPLLEASVAAPFGEDGGQLGDVAFIGLSGNAGAVREVTPPVDPTAQQVRQLQALLDRYAVAAEAAAESLAATLLMGGGAFEDEAAVADASLTDAMEAYAVRAARQRRCGTNFHRTSTPPSSLSCLAPFAMVLMLCPGLHKTNYSRTTIVVRQHVPIRVLWWEGLWFNAMDSWRSVLSGC